MYNLWKYYLNRFKNCWKTLILIRFIFQNINEYLSTYKLWSTLPPHIRGAASSSMEVKIIWMNCPFHEAYASVIVEHIHRFYDVILFYTSWSNIKIIINIFQLYVWSWLNIVRECIFVGFHACISVLRRSMVEVTKIKKQQRLYL